MSKKNIVFIGDCFYPDVAATGQLLTDICCNLQQYFNITVLTHMNNGDSNMHKSKYIYEKMQEISIIRVKTKSFNKSNKISRIRHIIEYYFSCRRAIKKLSRQDIVFTISQPPILGGLLGMYTKKIHKCKFIYNIQDFNPEQAEAIKYIKYKIMINLLKKIDINTCKKADKIIIVGNDMKDTLRKRNILLDDKVSVINNWINEKEIYPLFQNENITEFKRKYDLENKFIIMYSGNIGLYYDIENIVKVIKRFQDIEDIYMVLVGEGIRKEKIQKWVNENNIKNLKFVPFQPKSELIYSLNAADVHLISNCVGIKGVSVPSKIYGIMASGKYVIGILEKDSEAFNLITKSSCGRCVEPNDYDGLYNLIRGAYEHRDKLKEKGLMGRKHIEQYYNMNISISKYKEIFEKI